MFSQSNQFYSNEHHFASTTGALNWNLPPDISPLNIDCDPSSRNLDASALSQQPVNLQLLLPPENAFFPSTSPVIDPANYLFPNHISASTIGTQTLFSSPHDTTDLSWLNSYLPSPPSATLVTSFHQPPLPVMAVADTPLLEGEEVKHEHGAQSSYVDVFSTMLPASPPQNISPTPCSPSTASSRSSSPDSLGPSVTEILTSCESLGISPSNLLTDLGSIPAPTKSGRNIAPKIYSCPVDGCHHTFTRLFNLRAHAKTHDPTRSRPFQCSECDKSFCRQHDLDRHATVHTKVRAFNCSYCLRPFTRIDAKNRHERDKCHVVKAIRGEPKVAAAVLAAVVANHAQPDESG